MAAKKTVTKKAVSKRAGNKKIVTKNSEENQTKAEATSDTKKKNLIRARRLEAASYIALQKFTDEEIAQFINEKYPINSGNIKNPITSGIVAGIRWHLVRGNIKQFDAMPDLEKIVEVDGVKMKISEKPSRQKKAKKDKESAERLAKYGVKTKTKSKKSEAAQDVVEDAEEKTVKKVRKRAAKKQTTKKTSDE